MKKMLLANGGLGKIGGPGLGPFAEIVFDPLGAIKTFTTIISNIIGFITIAAGVWFMFQFIVAGISWLNAGGNKEAVSGAQDRMRNALIGITIVVAAWALVGLFGSLLGLDILIRDPGRLIEQLGPGG